MVINNKKKSKPEKMIDGISLAFTFVLFGIFLYFTPGFFNYHILTAIVGLISIVIGIIGLSFELAEINEESVGFSDLGMGLGFIIIWAIIYYFFSNVLINILSSFILFFGLYGSFSGLVKLTYGFIINKESKSKIITKISVVFMQIIGFVSAILSIISFIGLLK